MLLRRATWKGEDAALSATEPPAAAVWDAVWEEVLTINGKEFKLRMLHFGAEFGRPGDESFGVTVYGGILGIMDMAGKRNVWADGFGDRCFTSAGAWPWWCGSASVPRPWLLGPSA